MKKIFLIFFLLISSSMVLGRESTTAAADLSGKDLYQAEQWLQLIRDFWEVEDYAALRIYCRKMIAFYPETYYAREAEEFLKKTENPAANARRSYRRRNPGLFP